MSNNKVYFKTNKATWNHGMVEIILELTEAGLHIEYLKKIAWNPINTLPNLIKTENGLFETKAKLFSLIFQMEVLKL